MTNEQIEEERLKSYYRKRDISPRTLASGKFGMWLYAARYILQRKDNVMFPILLNIFNFNYADKVNILDIGCGDGMQLFDWIRYGAEQNKLYGIDILQERVWQAKDKLPKAHITCGNAANLEHKDKFFHIITLNTVLSSIIDKDIRKRVCSEAVRVMADNGFIVVFDYKIQRTSKEKNSDISPLGRKDLKELFPNCTMYFKTFTPMYLLTSRKVLIPLVRLLDWLKFQNVHYIAILKKRRV